MVYQTKFLRASQLGNIAHVMLATRCYVDVSSPECHPKASSQDIYYCRGASSKCYVELRVLPRGEPPEYYVALKTLPRPRGEPSKCCVELRTSPEGELSKHYQEASLGCYDELSEHYPEASPQNIIQSRAFGILSRGEPSKYSSGRLLRCTSLVSLV